MLVQFYRVWRKGGTRAVLSKVKQKVAGTRRANAYQDKTGGSTDVRWRLVRDVLPKMGGSLLDIGCNLGTFTALAAESGFWSVGIEADAQCLARARERHFAVENCGFVKSLVDLDIARKLPRFDVTLLLSVHHNWYSVLGPEIGAEVLRTMVDKTNKVLIFEGPSRQERYYGNETPHFIDNDEHSVTSYYSRYLADTLADKNVKIALLGSAPCVGEREPLRWIYAITK